MGIDDVNHIAPEDRAAEISKYPEHEREARVHGHPMLGSGRIYPIAEDVIREPDLAEIPDHWAQLLGLDFGGFDHPTAAVHIAHNPTDDCVHLLHAYRQSKQLPIVHASAISHWGADIPVAWPHDGLQHDKGSMVQLKDLYSRAGLAMLSERAQFPDDRGNGVEAGLLEILDRMQTGRLRVAASLSQWWEEFRGYHRRDGRVVKERDDLLDATRYAIMALRYAQTGIAAARIRDRYADKAGQAQGDRTWMST